MINTFLANNFWGEISPPPGVVRYDPGAGGLINFLNAILRLVFVGAGLFAFFNFIIAGFGFISAGGDPKAINNAWNKIWQSLLGLLIIVGSFVLAGIFGWLIYGDPTAILQPKITTAPTPTP